MHVQARVADQLEEDRLRLLVDRPAERRRVGAVHVGRRDADLGQRVGEQVVRAAVQAARGDDVVAGPGEVEDAQRLGGLTGADAEGGDATFERRDALLEDVRGRVHDPGVDVPELLEPEEARRVGGVVEDVARRGVDRDRPGVRGRVGLLPAVERAGLGAERGGIEFGHVVLFSFGGLAGGGGPGERFGGHPSCGSEDKRKAAAPMWSPRPRDRVCGPAPTSSGSA